LNSRYLLDTHILVRWMSEPKRLSREQTRVIRDTLHRREQLAISAVTLLEIATLFGKDSRRSNRDVDELLRDISTNPAVEIIPLSVEVASEVAALGNALKDPIDRAIVATARIHRLTLITSDERIIASELVRVID
jgi:PIN domain nuclease of toxin-antitoxin system